MVSAINCCSTDPLRWLSDMRLRRQFLEMDGGENVHEISTVTFSSHVAAEPWVSVRLEIQTAPCCRVVSQRSCQVKHSASLYQIPLCTWENDWCSSIMAALVGLRFVPTDLQMGNPIPALLRMRVMQWIQRFQENKNNRNAERTTADWICGNRLFWATVHDAEAGSRQCCASEFNVMRVPKIKSIG